MIEPNNAFATIAEVIDANHYGVVTHWGQRIEAVYYRTGVCTEFVPGDHIFMERARDSQLWVIVGHAFMNPNTNPGQTNFLIWDVGRWNQKHWAP